MKENKLIIAAAGAGKTTYLVDEAFNRKENVLITTFTEENEAEIHDKFIKRYGCVPGHVTIQTWFSFLLKHGVKPYQGACNSELFDKKIKGIFWVDVQSGVKKRWKDKHGHTFTVPYDEEKEFERFFFTTDMRLYTDKLSRFVVRADKKSQGNVMDRISRLYPTILIDEVQDMAGYDLEILKMLYRSTSTVICVGDPRQVTYYTHWERTNKQYRNGLIKQYVLEKCCKRDHIIIDELILAKSHRNNKAICDFSSRLFPKQPIAEPCDCERCHPSDIEHQGVYIVSESDIKKYLAKYHPIQLRHDVRRTTDSGYISQNFGQSKGKTYDRVVIYPTDDMKHWLINNNVRLADETRAKLYVAVTRAKYSVAFVIPDDECDLIKEIGRYNL